MKRGLLILALVAAALVIGYNQIYPTVTYHVRLSVVVDHGGKTQVGSSVVEISVISLPTFGGVFDQDVMFRARGEAAFLDLGAGNNILALLGQQGSYKDDIIFIAQRTFFGEAYRKDPEYGSLSFVYQTLATNTGKPRELSGDRMPILARFRDINDPKTIEAVDPANLEASYGPDFHLSKVTLEITDDSVTSGVIEKRLPWLHAMIGDSPNDPTNGHHYYIFAIPELSQEPIFFDGFVRK